jgi:hypothetical protein
MDIDAGQHLKGTKEAEKALQVEQQGLGCPRLHSNYSK